MTGMGTETTRANLERMFEKSFGLPLDRVVPLAGSLVAIDVERGIPLLLGSEVAAQKTYLAQSDIDPFLEHGPPGYFLTGFWGHGINSFAFYFQRVDEWSRIFFRLPCGGVYSDNERMAQMIPRFLSRFLVFAERIRPTTKSLVAIDSMHKGYYKIIGRDGTVVEYNISLLAKPNFELRFQALITEENR